jgi:hypothetical protein
VRRVFQNNSKASVIVLSAMLLVALPAKAGAEWQLAPFIGWTFHTNTTLFDPAFGTEETHWNFGTGLTLLGAGPVGVEALFVYTPSLFGGGEGSVVSTSRSIALMGNVVLTTPRSWNEYGLRPFVSGGLGLLHAGREDLSDVLRSHNIVGMNVGGGAVGFLSNSTGLRFDLRYFRHLQPVEVDDEEEVVDSFGPVELSYWTASVGVVFRF